MDFQQTLEQHLKAIKSHNLSAFAETLANDGSLILIFPNGRLMKNYEAIVDFHEDWFDDPDWDIEFKTIETQEEDRLAWVLLQVSYNDLDEDDMPYHLNYYLHLIFRKFGQRWRLVFDQNTVMEEA